MGTQPQGAIRAGLRAARRERRGVGVAVLGRALLLGALVAAVLIAADRLLVLNLAWGVLVAGPMVGAAIGALLWSMRRPARAMHGAALIDASLASHDRVRNAIALGEDLKGEDDAFARLAIDEGERAAHEADIARAAPIRFGWTWLAWPSLGALAVLGGLLLPYRAIGEGEATSPPATLAERTEAIEQVEDALQAIREAAAEEPGLEGASPEELERLADIESELREGLTTPEEARAEAASTLERAAETLEDKSLRRELERDAFDELTRELDTPDDAMSKELADRLRSGDFEQASEAVRELLKQSESMSQDEREKLAGELESLSEQLRQAAEDSAAQNPPTKTSEPQQPGEPGTEQAPPNADPRSPQEQLEREQGARERAREDAERLSDALRRSADEARKDPEQRQPRPGEPSPREPAPESGEQEPGNQGEQSEQGEQEPREAGGETRDGEPREGEEGSEQPQPGAKPQDQSGEGPSEQEGQRPERGEEETPSERETGEQRQEGERRGKQETQGQEPPDQQPGQREGGEQDPGASPDAKPGEQGQERSPGQRQGERPGTGEQGEPESLEEQLRRMGEQGGQGSRQRERADELRQRARRLMGEPEPEGGGPVAGEQEVAQAPEAPAPIESGPTTPVDARNTPEDERAQEQVIGDWYSDEALSRDPAARREAGQRIQEAKAGAERAIEQQRVPRRRREFLRRVYERYAESSDAEGGGLSPAGQDSGGEKP